MYTLRGLPGDSVIDQGETGIIYFFSLNNLVNLNATN
jgi:hypothetical protein